MTADWLMLCVHLRNTAHDRTDSGSVECWRGAHAVQRKRCGVAAHVPGPACPSLLLLLPTPVC
jgi:hypothetical protein